MMPEPDPFVAFKQRQREMWASFAPTALYTTPVAGQLVKFGEIAPGERVLDVATGTGVVAITAARAGAVVQGVDLTPELIAEARRNAQLAGVKVDFREGDAEALPFDDASFDVVTSEFGHMFAPRPEVAIAEMRRVLRPGGRVVFATWPPEHLIGHFFNVMMKYAPPPPPGVAPPPQWGVPAMVAERLAAGFHPPFFGRGVMAVPALSLGHFRTFLESSVGLLTAIVESLAGDPQKLAALRNDIDAITRPYYSDNLVRQHYLFTRAVAR